MFVALERNDGDFHVGKVTYARERLKRAGVWVHSCDGRQFVYTNE